jgi:hypothetical protein
MKHKSMVTLSPKHSQIITQRGDFRDFSGNARLRRFLYQHSIPAQIVQAYGSWVQDQLNQGWDGYLISFMFRWIPGSMESKVEQMQREIIRLYGKLASKAVRKPTSPKWAPLLPKGVFFPDVPGLNGSKRKLPEVVINDGLHVHGIVLVNRRDRLKEPLGQHFQNNQRYYRSIMVHHLHIVPITHDAEYTTDYGGKAIKKGRISEEHILVLPRSLSELPVNNYHLSANPRERAIKDIQSSTNVSEELAERLYDAGHSGTRKL